MSTDKPLTLADIDYDLEQGLASCNETLDEYIRRKKEGLTFFEKQKQLEGDDTKTPITMPEVPEPIYENESGTSLRAKDRQSLYQQINALPIFNSLGCFDCLGTGKILEDHDGRTGYRRCHCTD